MVGMSISAEGTVGPSAHASLDVLVRHLMQEMDALRDRVRKQERKQQADHDELSERVNKIDIDTRASLQALAARTEEERRQDIRLAARALPLIILGVVLTGVPDGLAAGGSVGWALAGISALLALWLGAWTAAAWIWRRVRHS